MDIIRFILSNFFNYIDQVFANLYKIPKTIEKLNIIK
jgi:hypothetical protein